LLHTTEKLTWREKTKLFLSWSPVPPDPPYWDWIDVQGIVVSIGLLKQEGLLEKASLIGLHDLLRFNGTIFLDSGSYEDFFANKTLRPKNPEELLTLAKWIGVNFVSHSDIPFIGKNKLLPIEEKWGLIKQNILNAEIAYNYAKRNCSKTEVIYVIQGWDEESLRYCSEAMAKLEANYYAVGSLIGLLPEEIIRRVKLVRGLIGSKANLHLFAVANPVVIKEVKSLINSVDCSSAGIAGAMKEVMKPTGGRVNINKAIEVVKCDCPVCCKYNAAIFLNGSRGFQNHYNKLRKIHNAYQLTTRLKKEVENSSLP